jgi:general secretion pathway protein D
LGRLFTSNLDNRTKTEIVLLITPYVVHNLDRPPPSALELASGTEASLGAGPLRLPSGITPPPRPQVAPIQSLDVQPPLGEPLAAQRPAPVILLSAPPQVQAGREFAAAISIPPGLAGSVQLELTYDTARVQAVGIEAAAGRVALTVAGTATVRFRALEGQSGPAQIAVGNVQPATTPAGETIQFTPPAPVTVNVVP